MALPVTYGQALDSVGRVLYQRHLGRCANAIWAPLGNSATQPTMVGMAALTAVGTLTARNWAATSMATRMRRLGIVSAATAGAMSSLYSTVAQHTIGNGAGMGGFTFVWRFMASDAVPVTSARMFVGLRAITSAPTNVEPSTLVNCMGVAKLAASNNLQIVSGGSAAQAPIDLGANFPANTTNTDVYELVLFADPATQTVRWVVTRLNTGESASGLLAGTVGTTLPALATALTPTAWRSNNTTAQAVGLDLGKMTIESDL